MTDHVTPGQPGSPSDVDEREPRTPVRTMAASSGDDEGADVTEPTPTTHVASSSDPAPTGSASPHAPLHREMDPLADTDPTTIHQYELAGRVPGNHASDVYLVVSAGAYRVLKMAPSTTADSHSAERFARELRNAKRVRSPRVAEIVDSGEWQGRSYLVQEFINGPSVAELFSETDGRPMDAGDIARLATGIAEALIDLQRAEVVHRDVTPSNVLVHPDRGAVLVDFGISRAKLDPGLTSVGVAVGTPGYMSPEQLRGERATNASDVFQWGLVVGQALLGRHPVDGVLDPEGHLIDDWVGALAAAHIDDALLEHPGRLGRLVQNALDPDRSMRPSARALLADIDRTSLLPLATETMSVPYSPKGLRDARNLREAWAFTAGLRTQTADLVAEHWWAFATLLALAVLLGWMVGGLLAVVVAGLAA